jgi:hypothetical protein
VIDARALPAHYAEPAGPDEDLRPTPGIEASEHGDPALADDMRAVNEHWRRRGKRTPPTGRRA